MQRAFFDTQRDELCGLVRRADGDHRCLPITGMAFQYSYVRILANAQCTGATVASFYKQACAAPKYVTPPSYHNCGLAGQSLMSLGEKVSTPYYESSVNGDCLQWKEVNEDAFRIGSAVDLGLFAQGVVEGYGNTGRLQPLVARADGLTLFTDGFWDTKHNGACMPARAVDGKLRCLPKTAIAWDYYLDANCTKPALAGECELGALALLNVDDPSSCTGDRMKVVEVGAVISPNPQQAYRSYDGKCIESGRSDHRLWEMGAELPASDFVEVKEVVE